MKYSEALDYLYNQLPMFQRQGKKAFKKDLKNIKALTAQLSNPHKTFRSIHIAGTNGKGSTAHVLAALLQCNGLKIGLYSSPHYKDFRERIKINGRYVDKVFVKKFVKEVKAITDQSEIKASFFEITVAMAFQYFAENEVDFAIIETGLGGRLDSTNIIQPELSVITNIALDHTAFLGNTLKKIAKEKAGIIKAKVPVVISERQKEVDDVFITVAKKKAAPIYWARKSELEARIAKYFPEPFALKNIRGAISAYKILAKNTSALNVDDAFILNGIKNFKRQTNYIGRWQILGKKPLIIADSAHNEAGLKLVFNYIKQVKYEQLHIVFGMVGDKPADNIYPLLPKVATYYLVQADIPRAKDRFSLKEDLAEHGIIGKPYSSVRQGLSIAKRKAKQKDLILVIGSIFIVAEVV